MLLKKNGVELELIQRGMRGKILMASKSYAKANNLQAADYNPSKPNKYFMYFVMNNFYGWAMSLPLPKVGFKWKRAMPTEEQIMTIQENTCVGLILEANLEYPEELHKAHNSYPLAPEKKSNRGLSDVKLPKQNN